MGSFIKNFFYILRISKTNLISKYLDNILIDSLKLKKNYWLAKNIINPYDIWITTTQQQIFIFIN